MRDFFPNMKNTADLFAIPIQLEKKIPDEMPKYTSDNFLERITNRDLLGTTKELILKDAYNKFGMFGFVSWRWINPLAEWINGRKCLEIMAGRGWLSHALQIKGVDIIATDDFSWHAKEEFSTWKDTVTTVEKLNAVDAITKYGQGVDIMLVSWPYIDKTAFHSLKKLYEVNPNTLFIFIGEWNTSVCANKDFFNSYQLIEDPHFQRVSRYYQSWACMNDRMYLGKFSFEEGQGI